MINWKVEPLPIHGYRIVDVEGNEIVRDIYEQRYAEQIAHEHNAVAFAINNGAGWIFEDWQNWRRHHAIAPVEPSPATPERE